MKWPLPIISSLLLGVTTAFALAWACALWSPLAMRGDRSWNGTPPVLSSNNPEVFALLPTPDKSVWVTQEDFGGLGLSLSIVAVGTIYTDETSLIFTRTLACWNAGWPYSMLYAVEMEDRSSPPVLIDSALYAPQILRPTSRREIFGPSRFRSLLPITVNLIGIIINSSIFSLSWMVLIFLCIGTKTFIRKRQGKCTACGYPRSGRPLTSKCPECGY